MTIHHLLRQATQQQIGKLLTRAEIIQLVLEQAPQTKHTSILPAEHHRFAKKCKRCKSDPIFEKSSHGLFLVLPPTKTKQNNASIHALLFAALKAFSHKVLSVPEMRARVKALAPEINALSVIPAEHVKGGACKACLAFPLLERTTRGLYRVADLNLLERLTLPGQPELTSAEAQRQLLAFQLHQVVKTYGREKLLKKPEKFIPILQERFENYPRETHLLQCALTARIVEDLQAFGDLLSWPVFEERLVQRLYEQFGLSLEFGRWAVQTWGFALELFSPLALGAARLPLTAEKASESAEYYLTAERIRASEIPLRHLHINHTQTGYDALKKHGRNLAMVLFDTGSGTYVLGLKDLQKPELDTFLAAYVAPEKRCPSAFLAAFSPQGRSQWRSERYLWYLGLPRAVVVQVFQMIERLVSLN